MLSFHYHLRCLFAEFFPSQSELCPASIDTIGEIRAGVNGVKDVFFCQENPVFASRPQGGAGRSAKTSAHEDKRRPVVRVGVALAQFDHGLAERLRAVGALEQTAVEALHEVGGRRVVNIPQGEQEILRPA